MYAIRSYYESQGVVAMADPIQLAKDLDEA